jgi:hypothetical protein
MEVNGQLYASDALLPGVPTGYEDGRAPWGTNIPIFTAVASNSDNFMH